MGVTLPQIALIGWYISVHLSPKGYDGNEIDRTFPVLYNLGQSK